MFLSLPHKWRPLGSWSEEVVMSGLAVSTPRAKGISSSEESVFSKLIRFIFIAVALDLGE